MTVEPIPLNLHPSLPAFAEEMANSRDDDRARCQSRATADHDGLGRGPDGHRWLRRWTRTLIESGRVYAVSRDDAQWFPITDWRDTP